MNDVLSVLSMLLLTAGGFRLGQLYESRRVGDGIGCCRCECGRRPARSTPPADGSAERLFISENEEE